MSQIVCKNCGNEFEGNFCNICGQKASVKRLTYESLGDNLMHGFLHVDKGFFYTIKMLVINPGKVVNDFINCKRAPYFQPFPLLIILSTVYGILDSLINRATNNVHKPDVSFGELEKPIAETINFFLEYITHNFALINIFLIPPFALAVRFAFRKANSKKFNFVEYFFGGAYLSSLYLVINIALIPFIFLSKGTTFEDIIDFVLYSLYFIVTVRYLYELFQDKFWKTTRRTIYAFCLYGILFIFFFLFYISLIVLAAYGKEALIG